MAKKKSAKKLPDNGLIRHSMHADAPAGKKLFSALRAEKSAHHMFALAGPEEVVDPSTVGERY
jgi:hypothetical protein